MLRITDDERCRRIGARHALAAPVGGVAAVAEALVAVHSTDPASVFLSVRARCPATPAEISRALYEDRSVVRLMAMRRTVFVVARDLVPALQAAAAPRIEAQQRKSYGNYLGETVPDPAALLAAAEEQTMAALVARGGMASAMELAADVPLLRTTVHIARGKSYGREQTITSWVLLLLSLRGLIVRGPTGDSWTSQRYRWVLARDWLGELPRISLEEGRTELVRRWLRSYGPGLLTDLTWWTGWPKGHVRAAVAGLPTVEVELESGTGILLADDAEPTAAQQPWVALLPALDATAMGWSARDFYLGPHRPALFDTAGNVGPTVWADGRVIGGWAQRADGEVVVRLLEDVGRSTAAAVDTEASRVQDWLGEVRFLPRFRTPTERALLD